MKNYLNKNKGYTLIELILYISLAAVMLLAISMALSTFFEARIKSKVISELDGEGTQAMQLITQTIRNANSINSPLIGINDSSLSLNVIDPSKDPTVFSLVGGEIIIKEGLNSEIPLTNKYQTVSSGLLFENLSRPLTPGTIGISFISSHLNPEGRNEYNYSRSFYGTATLRH